MQQGAHLALGQRPGQLDPLAQPQLPHERGQRVAELPLAGDHRRDLHTGVDQGGQRPQQDLEALLGHQAAHRGHPQGGARRGRRRRPEGEAVELQGVVAQADPRPGPLQHRAQVALVEPADGDDPIGVGAHAPQPDGVDAVVEDVLGVGGHRVGDATQARGDPGDARRQGGEVRVQVGHAVGPRRRRQGHALGDVVARQARQDGHDPGQARALPGVGQRVRQQAPQLAGLEGARHPRHPRADPGDLRVEARVGGGAQRVDGQVVPQLLAGQDLGDDEGLGEAGVDLENVSGAAHEAFSCRR